MATKETTTDDKHGKKNNSTPAATAAAAAVTTAGTTAPPATAAGTTAMTPPPETQSLEVFDYGDDAGQGFENQTMADRKLPIIELLQSNSPEVVESRGKVWAGQFRNSVTGEIFDEVLLVAGITDNCWTEWIGRDDGGGFRGRHQINSKIVRDAITRNEGRAIGKLAVPQPNDPKTGKPQPQHELVESFEIYAILYNKSGEVLGFAMIPFTSTKIKIYRAWNSAIGGFAPTLNGKKLAPGSVPIFAHRVKMTSATETKNGNTYMVPVLSPAEGGDDLKNSLLPKTDARYIAAKKLHDDVIAGLAKAAYETSKQDPASNPEDGVPF
jgi:hypothetical protein